MKMDAINAKLNQLQQAADEYALTWPEISFHKVSGPGPGELLLSRYGDFQNMALEPGKDLVFKTQLNLPEKMNNISIVGDALELTIFALYPMELHLDGAPIFKDDSVPVASGPALVTVLPQIKAGDNGELTFTLRIPDNQTTQWINIHFTTPRLRKRGELLDTAWAELTFAAHLAQTAEEQQALVDAVALIPDDIQDFTPETLKKIEAALSFLQSKAKQYHVHVIGHSHIDMNWLWTWPDTRNVILRDFKSVLDMMDDYPELTFTHSQPATYDQIRKDAPQLLERVKTRIAEGRWEPATITWVEGDTNMASGEAMARQMLESSVFNRDVLNTQASTFLMPDTFGHAGNLPQLAVSAGAKRYYHHRANPGQSDMWPAYWWQGQDGSRILAVSTPSYNGNIRARDLVSAALTAKKFNFNQSVHFHGIGDHGGGPARHNLDALRRFQHAPLLPKAACSTLAAYTEELLASGAEIPEHIGESSTIFEGCYTTHDDIKQENRAGENLLSSTDTLTALAGLDYREALSKAWRMVCFNQFHDIFDGSAIHEVYADSTADFENISKVADEITTEALKVLSAGLPEGAIAVTNPLGWEQSAWVQVPELQGEGAVQLVGSHGHETVGQYSTTGLGFVACVPAYATVSYTLKSDTVDDAPLTFSEAYAPTDNRSANFLTDQNEQPPYYRIDTPDFTIYLRRDSGILTSFYDKRVRKELVAYGMRKASDYMDTTRADLALNVLQIDDEHPHGMSAWQVQEVHSTRSLLRGAQTEVIESGPVRVVFEVNHIVRSSTIKQQIIFYRDLARVDFITDVDWQEIGNDEVGVPNLKAAFTASLLECNAWFETPFAAVQRPANGQEVPALRWVDVGGSKYGCALMNDGKYGYDVLGTRIRLTLLRSGYNPDLISDIGQHTIRYSFVPHAGDWRQADIVRQGIGYNQPFLSHLVTESSQAKKQTWFPTIKCGASVVPSMFRQPREGEGHILRLYESQGKSALVDIGNIPQGTRVWKVNVLEQPLKELPVKDGKVELSFTPWQVKTILIQ